VIVGRGSQGWLSPHSYYRNNLAMNKTATENAIEKQEGVVLFGHHCEMCGRKWRSPEKADICPRCGHWHINLYGSTFLAFERN